MKKLSAELKLKNIKFIVTDVDGVLTDGCIYISDSGEQTRRFYVRDGLAMKLLNKKGIHVGILSAGLTDGAVKKRAEMLGISYCYVGLEKKMSVLEKWLKELNLHWEHVAFIGDDILDKEVMMKAGMAVCPADAVDSIKMISDIILETKGGRGCFRELADKAFDLSE